MNLATFNLYYWQPGMRKSENARQKSIIAHSLNEALKKFNQQVPTGRVIAYRLSGKLDPERMTVSPEVVEAVVIP